MKAKTMQAQRLFRMIIDRLEPVPGLVRVARQFAMTGEGVAADAYRVWVLIVELL